MAPGQSQSCGDAASGEELIAGIELIQRQTICINETGVVPKVKGKVKKINWHQREKARVATK